MSAYVKGDLTYSDEEPGLHIKYEVTRLTPSSRGIDHSECSYFVLDPLHDAAAREALIAYANSEQVRVYRPELARDIFKWLAEIFDDKANEES